MITKCSSIPQRVISAFMAFTAVALAYMLRISLSYAITQMVQMPHANINGTHDNPDVCPPYEDETTNERIEEVTLRPQSYAGDDGKYDWSQPLQGVILSSFYWGYILTHIPGGLISARVGGKYTLLLGVVIATVFTVFTPLAIQNGGPNLLIVFRVIVGMGEGIIFPSCNTLLAAWTPLKERSMTATIVYSGGMLGNIFGASISGFLISSYGWTSVFYWFSGASLIWCTIFWFVCYNNPDSHPFISEREKNYLRRELGELKRPTNLPPTPWKAILTSPPMLALVAAQIGHNWGLFIIMNDLPKYMNDVLRFSIKKNGLLTALPYTVLWIVALSTGVLSDYLIKRKYLNITNSRKIFTFISAIGPAIFIVLASYAGCNRVLTVLMFTIGMGLMGTFYSGIKANSLDLAPNYAGVVLALANGSGAIGGVVGPYIVGYLTEHSYLSEWRIVFWITFVIFVVTTIIYVLYASGEVQWWNTPESIEMHQQQQQHNKNIADHIRNGKPTQFSEKPV